MIDKPRWKPSPKVQKISMSVVAFICGSIVTACIALYTQQRALDEARSDAHKSEQRAAFFEVWSAAEKYAFYTTMQDASFGLRQFVDIFPSANPVAQILKKNFSDEDDLVKKAELDANLIFAGKRLQMTSAQIEIIDQFMETSSEKIHDDQQKNTKAQAIEAIRQRAKALIESASVSR